MSSYRRPELPLPDEVIRRIGLKVGEFDKLPLVCRQFARIFNNDDFKWEYLDRGPLPFPVHHQRGVKSDGSQDRGDRPAAGNREVAAGAPPNVNQRNVPAPPPRAANAPAAPPNVDPVNAPVAPPARNLDEILVRLVNANRWNVPGPHPNVNPGNDRIAPNVNHGNAAAAPPNSNRRNAPVGVQDILNGNPRPPPPNNNARNAPAPAPNRNAGNAPARTPDLDREIPAVAPMNVGRDAPAPPANAGAANRLRRAHPATGDNTTTSSSSRACTVVIPSFVRHWAGDIDRYQVTATYFWRLWFWRQEITESSALFRWVVGCYSLTCILFLRSRHVEAVRKVLVKEAKGERNFPYYTFVSLFCASWGRQWRLRFQPTRLEDIHRLSKPEQMRRLLKSGAIDPGANESEILYMAVCWNEPTMLEIILEEKAVSSKSMEGVPIQEDSGQTATMGRSNDHGDLFSKVVYYAIARNHIKCTEVLLRDRRVDPFLDEGKVLMQAIRHEWVQVVQVILWRASLPLTSSSAGDRSLGQVVAERKKYLDRALDLARQLGHLRIVEDLKAHYRLGGARDRDGDSIMTEG